VLGGGDNVASGLLSVAAGNSAHATHDSCFVWNGFHGFLADPRYSIAAQCFHIFGDFYVGYGGADPVDQRWVNVGLTAGRTIDTWTGAYLKDNGSWVSVSDRNRKTDFVPVDSQDVLEKVVRMPIQSWRFTNEVAGVKHIGPVAQDFWQAFGLNGDDDTHIADLDESGVALSAIQRLNLKLADEAKRRDAENLELKRRNALLEERIVALERLVHEHHFDQAAR
jgi:hypothetical protein